MAIDARDYVKNTEKQIRERLKSSRKIADLEQQTAREKEDFTINQVASTVNQHVRNMSELTAQGGQQPTGPPPTATDALGPGFDIHAGTGGGGTARNILNWLGEALSGTSATDPITEKTTFPTSGGESVLGIPETLTQEVTTSQKAPIPLPGVGPGLAWIARQFPGAENFMMRERSSVTAEEITNPAFSKLRDRSITNLSNTFSKVNVGGDPRQQTLDLQNLVRDFGPDHAKGMIARAKQESVKLTTDRINDENQNARDILENLGTEGISGPEAELASIQLARAIGRGNMNDQIAARSNVNRLIDMGITATGKRADLVKRRLDIEMSATALARLQAENVKNDINLQVRNEEIKQKGFLAKVIGLRSADMTRKEVFDGHMKITKNGTLIDENQRGFFDSLTQQEIALPGHSFTLLHDKFIGDDYTEKFDFEKGLGAIRRLTDKRVDASEKQLKTDKEWLENYGYVVVYPKEGSTEYGVAVADDSKNTYGLNAVIRAAVLIEGYELGERVSISSLFNFKGSQGEGISKQRPIALGPEQGPTLPPTLPTPGSKLGQQTGRGLKRVGETLYEGAEHIGKYPPVRHLREIPEGLSQFMRGLGKELQKKDENTRTP